MKRKDKVYQLIKTLSQSLSMAETLPKKRFGFSADEIAAKLSLRRNNTSADLTSLFREGNLIRFKGRPVLFFDRQTLESWLGRSLSVKELDIATIDGLENSDKAPRENRPVPFVLLDSTKQLIGSEGSLRVQVEQAKAAILYPPHGLHTLIVGPTGVGKTTFAEMMYHFAVQEGRLPPTAPFIIFNCADYAENAQLLLSHLFGHVKGAFTGAEREKSGIIEQADGGILLLDEVHRLPPEGQEMLFLLLDKGIYRPLGETEKVKRAQLLLIAATTEDPNSYLLKTFQRRIPMVIRLPGLNERPLQERIRLIKRFFQDEAKRVNRPIVIYPEAFRCLALYDCPGNIGQLRGDIQLVCARAFLACMTHQGEQMVIDATLLPPHITKGLLNVALRRQECEQFGVDLLSKPCQILPEKDLPTHRIDDYRFSADFYVQIANRWKSFRAKGYSEEQTVQLISADITGYFDRLMNRFNPPRKAGKEEILKLVSPKVFEMVEKGLYLAEKALGKKYGDQVYFGLSLHISILLKRLRNGKVTPNPNVAQMAKEFPKEFLIARKIRELVEEEFDVEIPADEDGMITVLLAASENENCRPGSIGILVLAHGHATASSMVEVANQLCGVNHAQAIDMPLDQKVETVLQQAEEKVLAINEGKGVLLLVDMGSLLAFADLITEHTGIRVRAVDMVSTPMVIEAVRKALIPATDLDHLVEDIRGISPYIGRLVGNQLKATIKEDKKRIILTSCLSGEGTAVKLAELLRGTLPVLSELNISIKPVNLPHPGAQCDLFTQHEILAVVGTVDLKIPHIPFISIQDIIAGTGIEKLVQIIRGQQSLSGDQLCLTEEEVLDVTKRALGNFLEFLAPEKTFALVSEIWQEISLKAACNFSPNLRLRFTIHTACMIERLIKGVFLFHEHKEKIKQKWGANFQWLSNLLAPISQNFNLQIPETEIAYLCELLEDEWHLEGPTV